MTRRAADSVNIPNRCHEAGRGLAATWRYAKEAGLDLDTAMQPATAWPTHLTDADDTATSRLTVQTSGPVFLLIMARLSWTIAARAFDEGRGRRWGSGLHIERCWFPSRLPPVFPA